MSSFSSSLNLLKINIKFVPLLTVFHVKLKKKTIFIMSLVVEID